MEKFFRRKNVDGVILIVELAAADVDVDVDVIVVVVLIHYVYT